MSDLKCDHCKQCIHTSHCNRIKVLIPMSNTRYYIDGVARIALCNKCYESGEALKEVNQYFNLQFGEIMQYDVNKERTDLYNNFKDTVRLPYDQMKVNSLKFRIDMEIWIYLLNLIMGSLGEGDDEMIVRLIDAGMLSIYF